MKVWWKITYQALKFPKNPIKSDPSVTCSFIWHVSISKCVYWLDTTFSKYSEPLHGVENKEKSKYTQLYLFFPSTHSIKEGKQTSNKFYIFTHTFLTFI